MIDTELVEKTEQDHIDTASVPQEDATHPDAPEKSPLELWLDKVAAMEIRIAQLEAALSNHGHSINLDTDQLAELVMRKVNALIGARL